MPYLPTNPSFPVPELASAANPGPYESASDPGPYESASDAGPYESAMDPGPYESTPASPAFDMEAFEMEWEEDPPAEQSNAGQWQLIDYNPITFEHASILMGPRPHPSPPMEPAEYEEDDEPLEAIDAPLPDVRGMEDRVVTHIGWMELRFYIQPNTTCPPDRFCEECDDDEMVGVARCVQCAYLVCLLCLDEISLNLIDHFCDR